MGEIELSKSGVDTAESREPRTNNATVWERVFAECTLPLEVSSIRGINAPAGFWLSGEKLNPVRSGLSRVSA